MHIWNAIIFHPSPFHTGNIRCCWQESDFPNDVEKETHTYIHDFLLDKHWSIPYLYVIRKSDNKRKNSFFLCLRYILLLGEGSFYLSTSPILHYITPRGSCQAQRSHSHHVWLKLHRLYSAKETRVLCLSISEHHAFSVIDNGSCYWNKCYTIKQEHRLKTGSVPPCRILETPFFQKAGNRYNGPRAWYCLCALCFPNHDINIPIQSNVDIYDASKDRYLLLFGPGVENWDDCRIGSCFGYEWGNNNDDDDDA